MIPRVWLHLRNLAAKGICPGPFLCTILSCYLVVSGGADGGENRETLRRQTGRSKGYDSGRQRGEGERFSQGKTKLSHCFFSVNTQLGTAEEYTKKTFGRHGEAPEPGTH